MAFSERFLDELIARNDIADVVSGYVKLSKRSGSNMFGLCPFHSEKTPSFSVSPERQIYHCFGCGKGGGVINFIMEIENLSFPDAVAFLARRVNMELPDDDADKELKSRRERLLAINRDAARFFYQNLSKPGGGAAAEYIKGRGITQASVTTFGLGAALDSWGSLTDEMQRLGYSLTELLDSGLAVKSQKNGSVYDFFRNRFMFPLIDVRGNVIGFSGRRITNDENERKFVHSRETVLFNKSRFLFGLNLAKKSKLGKIILVEGNVDVITLRQAGFDNAVASLGTSLTEDQARLISNYAKEVIIAYDTDRAGKTAAQRAIEHLEKLGVSIKVLIVPGNKDPDEFIRNNGAGAFAALLSGTGNHIEYRLENIKSRHAADTDEGKVAYLKEAAEMLSTLKNEIEREVYAGRVAEQLKISPESMMIEIKRAASKRYRGMKKQEERAARPVNVMQPKERSIRFDNPVSAAAEEGIVRLLLADPELAAKAAGVMPEEFSSEFLGRVFAYIKERCESRSPVNVPLMSAQFKPDEISYVARLLQKPASISNGSAAMKDYIAAIKRERLRCVSKDDLQNLMELNNKFRERKGLEDKDGKEKY